MKAFQQLETEKKALTHQCKNARGYVDYDGFEARNYTRACSAIHFSFFGLQSNDANQWPSQLVI